ncbi:MAG: hypothetical protein ABL931_07490 [Usitatibacteraceae bacterium]
MKRIIATAVLLLLSAESFAVGHIADISIVDRNQQRTLDVYWHEGRAYVEGTPGNEYQIVLRNQARQDVLAVVSVDGVNAVTGENANPRQGGYVIDKWQQLEVAGWRSSQSSTAAFYFTTIADSYAPRTGRPQNVGVIGVALYKRKAEPVPVEPQINFGPLGRMKKDRDQRSDQSRQNNDGGAHAERGASDKMNAAPSTSLASPAAPAMESPIGTGYGRYETSHARTVGFERATYNPEEVVTIYYDSRANLIARGIIRENYRPRRDPVPFPAHFVPPPPGRW